MKTGRELDALVAEKVMGWSVTEPILCSHGLFCLEHGGFPYYSTNIAAAWEVVEKVSRAVFELRLTSNSNLDGWVVRVWSGDGAIEDTRADSAPRAICLAALKFVGVTLD